MVRQFTHILQKIPEPLVLSLVLAAAAWCASLFLRPEPLVLIQAWNKGLWSLLSFSMQMVLCLSSGFALAQAPVIEKRLHQLMEWPKNFAQMTAMVAFVSMLLGMLHWGLGLAGGTLLVRIAVEQLKRNSWPASKGLLGAAGYLPLMIWHGGLSGSAPLLMSSQNHFLYQKTGLIELGRTIGHVSNLTLFLTLLIVMPLACFFWAKKIASSPHKEKIAGPVLEETSSLSTVNEKPWGLVVGTLGVLFVGFEISKLGFGKIGLNQINAFFLFLAVLFHARLHSFSHAFKAGVLSSWSIVLLFPIYGAIMALVKESGLALAFVESLTSIASSWSLPLLTFFSAGVLNIFIPSGGGQWAVQGPIAIQAGQNLGLAPELMIMAVAYGDQVTNMLQPFWALPLLGMNQLPARDLLRYTIPLMILGALFMMLTLFLRTL